MSAVERARAILESPETQRYEPVLLLELLVELHDMLTTHRHGYRWEPTNNDGTPYE